jgi:hypothetical protein
VPLYAGRGSKNRRCGIGPAIPDSPGTGGQCGPHDVFGVDAVQLDVRPPTNLLGNAGTLLEISFSGTTTAYFIST